MRTAQVLITVTEHDDDDVRVNLERVGGEDKGWALNLVADMLAEPDDQLEEVQLAGGLVVTWPEDVS